MAANPTEPPVRYPARARQPPLLRIARAPPIDSACPGFHLRYRRLEHIRRLETAAQLSYGPILNRGREGLREPSGGQVSGAWDEVEFRDIMSRGVVVPGMARIFRTEAAERCSSRSPSLRRTGQ